MDKATAQRLVRNTLKAPFDRKRYHGWVNELCNGFDDGKAQNMTVPDAFATHVKSCQRLGTFTSPEDELADVLVVQLTESWKLERSRTALRDFVAHQLKRSEGSDNTYKEAGLIAFVAPDSQSWRFSYVRMDYETKRDPQTGKIKTEERLTPARRYSYLVGAEEECHTAQTRFLPLLQNTAAKPTLAQIEETFSVESVTKEFFNEYARLFKAMDEALTAAVARHPAIHADFAVKGISTVDFAKKLLGQIVFLYFIQKKGWLGVSEGQSWGEGPRHFLRQLADQAVAQGQCLFNEVLEPLFYDTLATDRGAEAWCPHFKCRIPFLNGGLFEPLAGYNWEQRAIVLPNALFTNRERTPAGDIGTGILDIFDRYNFTVNEAEPLEKEVAIDPEMLGKVFENLIEENRRKGLGAFYTPREIVHYMCQESLINYLDTTLNQSGKKIERADVEALIREGEQAAHYETARKDGTVSYQRRLPKAIEEQARALDEALKSITVCDPAIGSGAFPVGMMTEIVRARMALTPYFDDTTERTAYHFKRHAIQNSLYGVDIDVGAVEIAKLRLWLSLVVDEEDVQQIKPLPNLDYKVVVGNSLLGFPFKSQKMRDIEKLKREFFDETDHSKKVQLKSDVDKLLLECLAGSKKSLGYEVNFDFEIHFSEVFYTKGGFDVVIGNPPYVDSETMVKNDLELRSAIGSRFLTTKGNWDLYIPFLELALQKLSKIGTSCLITPNKWLAIRYGSAFREFSKQKLYAIADYSRFRTFENVGIFPIVQLAAQQQTTVINISRFSDEHEEIFSSKLPRSSFIKLSTWGSVLSKHLPLILKLIANNNTLSSISSLEEAFTVGEAYKLSEIIKDKKEEIDVFKFVNTGTIEPMYSLWGFSPTTYLKKKYLHPVIEKNLLKLKFPRRYTQMSSPKIVISGMRYFESILDLEGNVVAGKSTVVLRGITDIDKWYCLLGILNSKLAIFFLKECYSALAMDGGINFSPTNVGEIPIPDHYYSKKLFEITKECVLLRKKCGVKLNDSDKYTLEKLLVSLNNEVYRIYGLTPDEIAVIENV